MVQHLSPVSYYSITEDFNKIKRIIESCRTVHQLDTSQKCVDFFYKKYKEFITPKNLCFLHQNLQEKLFSKTKHIHV